MALSGVLDAIQGKLMFVVNDDDIAKAANNAYTAICWNRYKKNPAGCPLKLSDVGHIIWAYTWFCCGWFCGLSGMEI